MPRELRPLVRALAMTPTELAGRPAWRTAAVVAAVLGVGPHRARRAADTLLEASGASRVLVVGLAGACDARLRVADVVAPASVVRATGGQAFEPDGSIFGSSGVARQGILATVDRIGAPVPHGATLVDMETAAVAEACVARSVPWDVRRAVSDVPGGLPAGIEAVLRPDGGADVAALARLLSRRPGAALALVRLGRDAGRAVRAVTAEALALLDDSR